MQNTNLGLSLKYATDGNPAKVLIMMTLSTNMVLFEFAMGAITARGRKSDISQKPALSDKKESKFKSTYVSDY